MATPVIRTDPLAGRDSWRETLRVVPAWIISAGIHALLIFLFWMIVGDPRASASADNRSSTETFNTTVEAPESADPPLTGETVGIDVTIPPGFDVPLISDVDVPGPVDPNFNPGFLGEIRQSPTSVPLPPGSGDGQGGAPAGPAMDGHGMLLRNEGGMRGLLNVPGGLGQRSGAAREQAAQGGGGSPESEAAVGRGLKWLALHQAPDGSWSLDQYHLHARPDVNSNRFFNDNAPGRGQKNDTAGAAFGLLPYLAAGITHKPSKEKNADNQYVKTVGRALHYLMSKQGKDGEFPGGMYAHGLASIAMCEAYGLTADPMLKPYAQAALRYIIQAQDPAGGGWRYQPRQGGDTSVVGWQVMALKSGQMAGLSVPNITLRLSEKWLDSCETHNGSDPTGGYSYVAGSGETATMSAVGLLCRQYLGTPRRNPALQAGLKKLMSMPPAAQKNIYYQYYATQVFHHMGGDYWDFWNRGPGGQNGMRDTLVRSQERDGSWSPAGDAHAGAGGRIMQTSLSLLTLEVYYRHLPLYQRVDTRK